MNDLLKHVFNDFDAIFTQPERDVISMPIEAVRDMWVVRWGDGWVAREQLTDDLWNAILARLIQEKAIERHYLPEKLNPVYKLKQDAA